MLLNRDDWYEISRDLDWTLSYVDRETEGRPRAAYRSKGSLAVQPQARPLGPVLTVVTWRSAAEPAGTLHHPRYADAVACAWGSTRPSLPRPDCRTPWSYAMPGRRLPCETYGSPRPGLPVSATSPRPPTS